MRRAVLLCLCNSLAVAQIKQQIPTNIYGGNNQFGNNNTQNIYSDVRLTYSMANEMDRFIEKMKSDSNFHDIRNFTVYTFLTSNGAAMKVDLIKYFTEKGLKCINNERTLVTNDQIVKGISISLSKKDSCLNIHIGVL